MQSDLISRDTLKEEMVRDLAAAISMSEMRKTDIAIRALYKIDESPAIDAVPVVRCKECKNRGTPYSCPMRKLVMPWQGAGSYEDCTDDDGYCHMGVKRDGGAEDAR